MPQPQIDGRPPLGGRPGPRAPRALPWIRPCRVFDKSMNANIASGPILIVRVLPGRQVIVLCRNSVKIDDSFCSFFIHSIFMQALLDMCVLLSLVRLYSHAAECRWCSYTSTFRGGRAQSGRVWPGRTWHEPGGSANSSISDSVRLEPGCDNLQVRSPHHPGLSDNVYLQNYACGYLNGRYRESTVNYAPTK